MKIRKKNYLFLIIRSIGSAWVPIIVTVWLIWGLWKNFYGNFWPDLRPPLYELIDAVQILLWSYVICMWWPFSRWIFALSLATFDGLIAVAYHPSGLRLIDFGVSLVLPFLAWILRIPPRTKWIKPPIEDIGPLKRSKPKKNKGKKNY